MKITIEQELNSIDETLLFRWADVVFPIEGRGLEWEKPEFHIVAWENERPIGHIGFGKYVIEADMQISVIGVGGVVVRPEWQGKGVPLEMFTVLHNKNEFVESGSLFTLFCPAHLVPYYEKHGYSEYGGEVEFLQGERYVSNSDFSFMYLGDASLGNSIKVPGKPW